MLHVGGNALQQVKFKYLAVVLTCAGRRSKEIDTQIGKANAVLPEIFQEIFLWWQNGSFQTPYHFLFRSSLMVMNLGKWMKGHHAKYKLQKSDFCEKLAVHDTSRQSVQLWNSESPECRATSTNRWITTKADSKMTELDLSDRKGSGVSVACLIGVSLLYCSIDMRTFCSSSEFILRLKLNTRTMKLFLSMHELPKFHHSICFVYEHFLQRLWYYTQGGRAYERGCKRNIEPGHVRYWGPGEWKFSRYVFLQLSQKLMVAFSNCKTGSYNQCSL